MNIRNAATGWEIKGNVSDWNPIYRESIIKYINCLDPLFKKAKEKSESEFILVLLRVREIQDVGWDSWENTSKAFDSLMKLEKRLKDFETTRHLFLWLYGHIVEASEPYEIIANLINIIEGKRFSINNFPDKQIGKYKKPQSPSEKIDHLIEMAKVINMENTISLFKEVHDRDLRNAIFHSDYSLHRDEVRILRGQKTIYSHSETQALINKALAYFESLRNILKLYTSMYKSPKIISPHPGFTDDPEEKIVTIIRRDHGVIGLKDNWSTEELKKGKIPFRIGRFMRYERKMLDRDPSIVVLPVNRIERVNKILNILPKFLSRLIVRNIEKYQLA